jgi:hypothetical protein
MRRLGWEHECHTIVMMPINANYEDVEEVMSNIKVKKHNQVCP